MKSKIIAVQEELLMKSEWEFFLKSSVVRVAVLSKHQLTLELSQEAHNKYKYNNFHAIHGVPSGIYPNRYDVYLFAPQNYEEAQQFSIKNPHVKVIVITTPEIELKSEDAGNFSVKTWQYVSNLINEMRGKKPKEEKEKPKASISNKVPIYDRPIPDQKIRRWSEPEPEVTPDEGSIMDDSFSQGEQDDQPRVY
jgi:hypothetical protein